MTGPATRKRKLVLKMSVSVDGFVAGRNGEIDWIFRSSGGADSTQWVLDTLGDAGVHIMGSGSYFGMAAFWPYSALAIAPPMNAIPKVVFSAKGIGNGERADRLRQGFAAAKTRCAAQRGVPPTDAVLQSWANPMVASGDLVAEVHRLKAQPGNYILAHGGTGFAQSLIAAGLVDEYRLGIHPVVLGQGASLFAGLAGPADLRLVGMTPFKSGAVAAVYVPA